MASGYLNLACYTGQIRTIHSFGVIPSDGVILDACEPNDETILCEATYDVDVVRQYIEDKCMDKREC